jgi:hypothetical protein
MVGAAIVRVVAFSTRSAWAVVALFVVAAALTGFYAVRHFAIATDTRQLFPPDLPWTARAYRYAVQFPEHGILIVLDAPTPEQADIASTKLAAALAADHQHFRAVREIEGGPFFAQNGLLFLPVAEVARTAGEMEQAAPLIGALSADPSLRGALGALSLGLRQADRRPDGLRALARPMNMAADTLDSLLAGHSAMFSWRALASVKPAASSERRFIEIDPVLDYSALEPGRMATDAIARTAPQLKLASDYQARIRMTGLVPTNDAQFATLKKHAGLNAAVSLAAVLAILWLALRSWQLILAVTISLVCGLAMSAGLGIFMVGALNLISVAFLVLFVGLGVDFGIQFAIRYRAERHETNQLQAALLSAARKAGGPLALAAAATAIGFASFLPTSYRGLGELGEIAAPGMFIAFLSSITLLPALLRLLKPGPEPRSMHVATLAPVDRFLQRYRIPVVATTLAVVAGASPLLLRLPFDFNPLHLQNAKSEAVATFLELRKEPETGADAIEIVKPNLTVADAAAQRLARLPEVSRALTLSRFVPDLQGEKLSLIRAMAGRIAPLLDPRIMKPEPSDSQNVEALVETAGELLQSAARHPGPGAHAAIRLSGLLVRLANGDQELRHRGTAAFIAPLEASLGGLRQALQAQPVSLATLPPDLKRDWLTPSGEARVEVLPKGDPDDTGVLRQFVRAVTAVEPDATGPAVLLYEAGKTTVRAFIEAGIIALTAIAVLLLAALRRILDMLLTLLPLMLATAATLELSVVLHLPLNFADIIALPLLLGVGVAFKIYYMMAWRRGQTALVQSTLSRAVIFSAMTTGTAFGSLWLSSNPGTSSMGQLMALALLCTMAAAVLFQPALMGPPKKVVRPESAARRPGETGAAGTPAWLLDEADDAAAPSPRSDRARETAASEPPGR